MNILLYGALVFDLRDSLALKLSRRGVRAEITRLKEDAPRDQLAAALAQSEVAIAFAWRHMPPAPRLKLLQLPGAGTDAIDFAALPPGVTACNAFGHDIAAAEYVVLAMLAWCHQLLPNAESFRAGSWRLSGRTGAPPHEELHAKEPLIKSHAGATATLRDGAHEAASAVY